ncbi:MAG: cytochrome c3 family protein [Proteobacteria bacterium]|nr:cytochrome c3 family protein [Pseudomonadota bacterium]
MSRDLLVKRSILFFLACLYCFLSSSSLLAGEYIDSAHGSSTAGVFRPVIGDAPPQGFGYSRGNCAHCHEQHASIGGSEPVPTTGGASSYELFANNFDTTQKTIPYTESDNFCFYCHNNPTSAQLVVNNDYSQNFGCAPQGPTTIMSAMNQRSYHNLYDVWNFSKDKFPWFTTYSNPCDACHNPHLAKRNWANAKDPAYSAISKPTDHFALWGTTETMDSSYNTKYEPPYCSSSLLNREPNASIDAATGRANTPDYVDFCITCHTTTNTIFSTSLNRNLTPINWSDNGDKHGLRPMDGSVSTKAPYDPNSSGTDFVLSCLDCHEAHGSKNVMLMRRRANGSDLTDTIATFETKNWGLICLKCHKDDAAAGIGPSNDWEYVHHRVSDAPYYQGGPCVTCHTSGRGFPINCQECHTHSGIMIIKDTQNNLRIGF